MLLGIFTIQHIYFILQQVFVVMPRIKEENGVLYVFDEIRKKYLVLTPEEKVRQGMITYLVEQLGYSKGLIKSEGGLKYNQLQKRTDIVVHNRDGNPYILVECKAEDVAINQAVVEQASRYNLLIKAPFLCVTNGKKTYCFQIDFENNTTTQLAGIPSAEV